MQPLTISLEFITGRCVAKRVEEQDEAEWPPHPGRVYMALAAACFEHGEAADEVAALHWLEQLPPPEIYASGYQQRSAVKYFVPVNDRITVNKSLLQTTPGLTRSKQERTFPTAIPESPFVHFVWPAVEHVDDHIEALARLCANTIRIGHSSSLVRAWAETTEPTIDAAACAPLVRWLPVTDGISRWRARLAAPGELQRLRVACKAEQIEQFAELKQQIDSSKGKPQKEAKQMFESIFGEPYKSSLRPPEPTPPTLGLWQGYRATDDPERTTKMPVPGEHFDSELLILTKFDGPVIGIQDCLYLTGMLRNAIMSHCGSQPPPEWLGGHDAAQGKPSEQPHTAFLPLPFVGSPYADGHIMGLALALPKQISLQERGQVLGPALFAGDGLRRIELTLGKLGDWVLLLEDRPDPPQTLNSTTWTRPSTTWASVTPVVLDRYPRDTKQEDRGRWNAEVRGIVMDACRHSGLPEPAEVDLNTTSWHQGSPRAYAKTRPLRTHERSEQRATLGDGFPGMVARPGKPSRPQIHVKLHFEQPVQGPVLIGAGRFLGYGMCKPVRN